jgi:hypothetical protein
MDCNNIKKWLKDLDRLKSSTIRLNDEINFDNVKTITIDIESERDLGIIIIYQDGYLFFDFMSKDDLLMKSNNWSDKYIDFNQLKTKIENAIEMNWSK